MKKCGRPTPKVWVARTNLLKNNFNFAKRTHSKVALLYEVLLIVNINH